MAKKWLILVNISWVLETNMYSAVIGWSVLQMPILSDWLIFLFKYPISLLIFDLFVLTWLLNEEC